MLTKVNWNLLFQSSDSESVSTMSQNRFLNPPNGVRPLVSSKPLPTSQNIVQQQKIVASLAASLTSSSVLTAGPRFLNPQPTTHNQQLANKYSINSSANNVGLTTAATPSKSCKYNTKTNKNHFLNKTHCQTKLLAR